MQKSHATTEWSKSGGQSREIKKKKRNIRRFLIGQSESTPAFQVPLAPSKHLLPEL